MSNKPNILIFCTDQQRYDHLGCMGLNQVQTPNIDSLAAGGVLFRRAYAVNTVCQPSRTTMLTGQTLRGHGRRSGFIPQNPDIVTLPDVLADHGYRTHAVGKLHLHNWFKPGDRSIEDLDPAEWPELWDFWRRGQISHLPEPYYGFQTTECVGGHGFNAYGDYVNWLKANHPDAVPYLDVNHPANVSRNAYQTKDWAIPQELHYNRWISDRTCDFLEKQSHTEQPFFLWCSFPDPHLPFAAPEPWCRMYDPEDMKLGPRREGELDSMPPFYKKAHMNDPESVMSIVGSVGDDEVRKQIAMTFGMVSFVDQEVGRVMSKMEGLNLLDNTIIVFISDHGDMIGDHGLIQKGFYQYRGAIQIPLIVAWKGHLREGEVSDALTGHIDLVPTLMDLCSIPVNENKQAKIPWCAADSPPPELPGKSLGPILEGRADRVNDYVIHEADMDFLGLRVRTFVTDRYRLTIYPGREFGELFDMHEDPDELFNLWDAADMQDTKRQLMERFFHAYVLQEPAAPKFSHTRKVIGQHFREDRRQ